MASRCDRCQKGNQHGKQIARARQGLNYRSSRIFRPNLHLFRVLINGRRVKKYFCTKCLRIVKKEEAAKLAAQKSALAKAVEVKKKNVKKSRVVVEKTPVKTREEKRADKAKKEAAKVAKLKAKEDRKTKVAE